MRRFPPNPFFYGLGAVQAKQTCLLADNEAYLLNQGINCMIFCNYLLQYSTQIYSMQKHQIDEQGAFPTHRGPQPTQIIKRSAQNEAYQAQFYQLFNLQCEVNHQLVLNSILAESLCRSRQQNHKKNPSSSQGSTLDAKLQHNDMVKLQHQQKNHLKKQEHRNAIRLARKIRNREKQSEDQDYNPSDGKQMIFKQKLCESKNIPKSYAKSIANFCDKYPNYIKKLLQREQINQYQFYEEVKRLKINVKSIYQLKSLWLPSDSNPFSKIMRIISMEYLRKHALHYIFGSRIQNYGKHVKYRQTMIRGVQNPQSFNYMKEF